MAGRGSETGSGNEAHRAPGESGQAEGAGYEDAVMDQARGASGDDLDRMEEKLERSGELDRVDPAHPGGRNVGRRKPASGKA
jgi:hypothetical protein